MEDELYGYAGKILRVNLTTKEVSEVDGSKYREDYLGGKGLAARLYWEEIGPEVQPFDPENKLFFTAGPLNATGAAMASKGCVGGKSPVWYPVHSFSHSTTGNFGAGLKRAGLDALIVEGKADHPVYLWIYNGRVEIRDAYDLWGKTTRKTRELLWSKHNKFITTGTIGPAGENMVVSASIACACNQVFGRGGFGAVMGSKNLKAIALSGKGRIKVANPQGVLEVGRDRSRFYAIKVGEKRIVEGQEIEGKAWKNEEAYNFGNVGRGETQLKDLARLGAVNIKPNACEGCYVFCRTKFNFEDGSQPNSSVICASNIGWSVPENIANKGGKKMLGVDSYEWAQKVDDLGLNVNDYSILGPMYGQSAPFDENEHVEGSLQGGDWLYQGWVNGILTTENTGLPWEEFGTKPFNDAFLMQVAYRQGFGEILAHGFRYATQYIIEHEEFGPNRARMEYIYKRINAKSGNMGCIENGHGQYVPNPCRSIVTACTDRTGSEPEFQWSRMTRVPIDGGTPTVVHEAWLGKDAKKIYDLHYWGKEVAHAVVRYEEFSSVIDSLVCCQVGNFSGSMGLSAATGRPIHTSRDAEDWALCSPTGAAEYLTEVYGKKVEFDELDVVGDRIANLVRAIWVRDGYTTVTDPVWGGEVDGLWDLHFERKDREGINYTAKEGFEAARQLFYEERGWIDGVPTRATLEKYGLSDVADDLKRRGLLPA